MTMKGIEGYARIPAPGWEDIQAEAEISGTTADRRRGRTTDDGGNDADKD